MRRRPTVVFLDANVLAKPVTRTILLLGGEPSGHKLVWSATAEAEADRHTRAGARRVSDIRVMLDVMLSPTGSNPERFGSTSVADRRILADAEAASARFLVTEDVDDFAEIDLAGLRLSAVNPDLFMSIRFDRSAYLHALHEMVANMTAPPRSPADMHSLVSRQHPRLFAAHAGAFPVLPAPPTHNPPAVLFRGVRCLRCGTVVRNSLSLVFGLGPTCALREQRRGPVRPDGV